MRDDRALDAGGRKSESNRGDAERHGKSERTMSKAHGCGNRCGEENGCCPGRRLLIDAEINNGPATEGDREPGHQPARADLDRNPFADAMRGTARQICEALRPRPSWSRPYRSRPDPRLPRLSPSARSFRLYHRAAPAPRLAAIRSCYTSSGNCTGVGRSAFTAAVGERGDTELSLRGPSRSAPWPRYREVQPCG